MKSLTLYHYWRSSASWRVRWALEIKQVAYQGIAVDLLTGQEKTEAYKKQNPAGYVPCLITEAGPLGESLAIIDWLEENYPEHSLYPQGSYLRARAKQLAETVNAGIQPLQNLDVTKKVSSDAEVQKEWTVHWIERGLGVFESLLQETRSVQGLGDVKYCLGNAPSIADLCLIPQCYSADRFKVSLEKFPICEAIYQYALASYECGVAHPERFKPN